MNPWLARLKNQNIPGAQATKPTKPATDTDAGSFVGFVAYPTGTFEKNEGREAATLTVATVATHQGPKPPTVARVATVAVAKPENLSANDAPAADHTTAGAQPANPAGQAQRLAAVQPRPSPPTRQEWPQTQADTVTATASAWWLLHYPDREPVQLVSHPPATLAQMLQQHPEALAAEPMSEPHPAPHLTAEADRSCWPHSSAMNSVEIGTFMARLERFTDKGMAYDEAEALADKLVQRDREGDDRRLCLECRHLQGAGRWRCGNWQQAGVAQQGLARDLVLMLQRCDGYHPAMQAQALSQTQQAQPKEHPHD